LALFTCQIPLISTDFENLPNSKFKEIKE